MERKSTQGMLTDYHCGQLGLTPLETSGVEHASELSYRSEDGIFVHQFLSISG